MATAVSMVLLPAGTAFDLDWAQRTLSEQGLRVEPAPHGLDARWDEDGPVLRIALAQGEQVARDTAAIAAGSAFEQALQGSRARFEIAIDDLDEALDEMNTLIEVQATLQQSSGGFLFNSWNRELTASDIAPLVEPGSGSTLAPEEGRS